MSEQGNIGTPHAQCAMPTFIAGRGRVCHGRPGQGFGGYLAGTAEAGRETMAP